MVWWLDLDEMDRLRAEPWPWSWGPPARGMSWTAETQ